MVLRFCFTLFFFLFITLSSAQDIYNQIKSIKTYDDDYQKIEAYQLLIKQQDSWSSAKLLGTLFHELGATYYATQQYDKALEPIVKAIAIRKRYKDDQLELLNESRYRLALIYRKQQNFKQQQRTFLAIINDRGSDNYTQLSHRYLSNDQIKKGDLYKALYFLNIGLSNEKLCATPDYELKLRIALIAVYSTIYESTFQAKSDDTLDLEIIKKHQKEIEKKFYHSGIKESRLYDTYINLANVYSVFNARDEALELYDKSKTFYESRHDTIALFQAINNIAIIYDQQTKHKLAAYYYKKVIEQSPDQEQIADAYNNMGYFSPTIPPKNKIHYAQKAIRILLNKEHYKDAQFTLPSLVEIEESGYEQSILTYLIDLTTHYLAAYHKGKEIIFLKEAQNTVYRIDELISLIRYRSTNEQSKLFWIAKGVNVYMLAVEISFLLKNNKDVFYFMEKNKGLLLQENIKTLRTRLELDIPPELLESEYNLYYKRQEAFEKSQESPNDMSMAQLFNELDANYTVFMDTLKTRYPEYANIKKEIIVTDIPYLNSGRECFVEYILNEHKGYGFFNSKAGSIVFEIPDVPELQRELEQLKTYFSSPILNKIKRADMLQKSHAVFNKLFPFSDAATQLVEKKITIVPDHTLQTFPFEALVLKTGEDSLKKYLVQCAEVSYLQSFSVFKEIKQPYTSHKTKLLVLAPQKFEDNSLPELTGSKELINDISTYQKTTVLFDKKATATNFSTFQASSEIIHLNTHSGIDTITKTPWIAFTNDRITLDELYGSSNQAELVVLDACKTNMGKLSTGEGVISLSRGFFYNGAQSVVASLWNVNEKSSNQILSDFYKNLQKGNTKSQALQMAKINYLNTHKLNERLPYYWAAFTLTGSTTKIQLVPKTSFSLLFYTLIFIVIAPFLMYIIKYTSSRKLPLF